MLLLKGTEIAKSFSESIGKFFGWVPLHPNTITLISVLFSIAGFILFLYSLVSIGFVFFVLAFFLDAVDGAVARAKNLSSKKGAFLDGISDRLVEFFLVLALFVSISDSTSQLLLLSILFFGTCMTSFVKAYAEHSGLLDHETAKKMPGILERAERSVLLLLVLLMLVLSFQSWVVYVLALIALLSFATFVQRVFFTSSQAPRAPQ
jgi:phosphatidylglycerophosphate synthase